MEKSQLRKLLDLFEDEGFTITFYRKNDPEVELAVYSRTVDPLRYRTDPDYKPDQEEKADITDLAALLKKAGYRITLFHFSRDIAIKYYPAVIYLQITAELPSKV